MVGSLLQGPHGLSGSITIDLARPQVDGMPPFSFGASSEKPGVQNKGLRVRVLGLELGLGFIGIDASTNCYGL